MRTSPGSARPATGRIISMFIAGATILASVAGSGIRFADLGTHLLKGVQEPWRLLRADA